MPLKKTNNKNVQIFYAPYDNGLIKNLFRLN